MIEGLTPVMRSSTGALRHDPDGITWLTPAQWNQTTWDGVPFNVSGKTTSEICAFLGSSPYLVKGLRQRFYEVNPFADNENPTVTEINNWNLEVIRHFRKLLGNPTPVDHDARLYLEASWADERKYTTVWDTSYPVGMLYQTSPDAAYVGGQAQGPCVGYTDTASGHCGAAFFPNSSDRAPYLAALPYQNNFTAYPELNGYVSRRSQTEGIRGLNPAGKPWSILLASAIRNWICEEGLSGHPGPYVGTDARRYFGCSWWWTGGTLNYRGKWHN